MPIEVSIKLDREYVVTESKAQLKRMIEEAYAVVKFDSVKQTHYDITVTIRNMATRPIGIWLMKCSYGTNFLINNDYISQRGQECDSNYPILVKFQAGESKAYKLALRKSIKFDYPCAGCVYGEQVEETRLGLIVVDDIFESKVKARGYDLAFNDKSKWKIVWSNPLRLLDKKR